jgi:predicted nucleotidyltransferase
MFIYCNDLLALKTPEPYFSDNIKCIYIAPLIIQVTLLNKEEFPVREVYLFGSYANGNPNEYSDIDLAIVSDNSVYL